MKSRGCYYYYYFSLEYRPIALKILARREHSGTVANAMLEDAWSNPCAVTQVRKPLFSSVKGMGGWGREIWPKSHTERRESGELSNVEANLWPRPGCRSRGRGERSGWGRAICPPRPLPPRAADTLPHGSRASSYQGRFLILVAAGCCCCLCGEVSMARWRRRLDQRQLSRPPRACAPTAQPCPGTPALRVRAQK